MLKITFIGAGSVVFTKNLVCDVLQFPELQDATICLMDIDPDRLKVAEVMARKVVAKLHLPTRVEATLDRRAAIRGADFVICTIQVGGYKPGTVIDFEIPKKYGLRQTIGDTLGVGGVFRGLRTIPKVLEIARDIAEVGAPGCKFLNYTNPMAMLCMAVDHAVGVPMVGLCHSVQGTSQQLAGFLGLPYKDITYKVAGINHQAFFLEFKYRGQDAYPLLFRLLEQPSFNQEKVRFEMMRRLGYFVTESSEHNSEYTPYFIHHGEEVVRRFDIPLDEYLRRCEAIVASWKEEERDLLGRGADIHIGPQTHEYGAFIIHSCVTNQARVVYGNVPNTGLITNLPLRCCVELPVLVDRQGFQPTHIGDLPPQLAALIRTNVNVQELTVKAALSGRREHIYHAVMSDPHTAAALPLDKIWAMCDDLIAAHQEVGLLGHFHDTVPGTGRPWAGTADRILATISGGDLAGNKGSQSDYSITLENPGRSAAKVRVRIRSEPPQPRPIRPITLVVPKGGKATAQFRAVHTAGPGEVFELSPECTTPAEVLCLPLVLEPRHRMEAKDGEIAVQVDALGVPLLRGGMRLERGALRFRWRVADTAVKLDEEAPWNASCVEVFAAPLGSPQSIRQWLLLPKEGANVLDPALKPVRKLSVRVAVDKGGYWLEGALPLQAGGVVGAQGGPFLFDLIIGAGAVGEAHGAYRVGMHGRKDSAYFSRHYALVTP